MAARITALAMAALFLVFGPLLLRAEEKKPDGEGGTVEEKEEASPPESDPKALEMFRKAVAWQGSPTVEGKEVKLRDLYVEELRFRSFGRNEFEGEFSLCFTLPDKVFFHIHTPSWWRYYRTNGRQYAYKTGASNGWEHLDLEDDEDRERADLIREAVRVVRLLFLRHFLDGDTVFRYLGRQTFTREGEASDPCHLIKCVRSDGDAILFYLGWRGGMPRCLVVHRFLNLEHPDRDFFLHLERFRRFNGVRLPTRIRVYVRELSSGRDRKFLFADLVDDREGQVAVNKGISPRLYSD